MKVSLVAVHRNSPEQVTITVDRSGVRHTYALVLHANPHIPYITIDEIFYRDFQGLDQVERALVRLLRQLVHGERLELPFVLYYDGKKGYSGESS